MLPDAGSPILLAMRKTTLFTMSAAAASVSVGLLATVAAAGSSERSDEAGLAAVRAITAQYHDKSAASADGFAATGQCIPQMGYHYVNAGRLDDRLEPSRPEALLYAPAPDGGHRLAGAEWVVVDEDQDLATDDDRPELFGHEFQGPMPGHAPGMPIHYDLHAYAWIENPNGGFAPFNPAITCP